MARIRFDGLQFDPADGTLAAPGVEPRTLRPQVARLLEVFLERPGEVLDRDTLCRAVWGEDRVVDFEAGLSALVKELRQALRAVDAPDTMLETVPRRGYRFHAEIEPDAGEIEPGAAEIEPEVADAPAPRTAGSSRTRFVVPGLLAAAVLLAAALVTWWPFGSGEGADPRPRLAVVPFEMLGQPEADPGNLDLILADSLLSALWQRELDGLVLLGRTSMGADLDGRARVEYVASELAASLVLEGSLIPERVGDRAGWRIEARLLRLPHGEVAWTATVSGSPDEPVAVGDVARTLADDLAEHWPDIAPELR